MELLFIVAFAAAGMAGETKRTFGDWGRRKLDASRSAISAKRAEYRPGGRYRSARGNARVRYVPFRAGWALADVVWSFCSAVRAGAVDGAERGRERYRSRLIGDARVAPGDDPNDVANCQTCSGTAVVDGAPCPRCLSRQQERNTEWEKGTGPRCHWHPDRPSVGRTHPVRTGGGPGLPACRQCYDGIQDDWAKAHADARQRAEESRTSEDELAKRRAATTAGSATTTGGTMSDAGSFEQVGTMLGTMREAAVFAVDDANNDLKRAQEDASNTEAMVSFAQSITAGPSYEQPLARTGDTSTAMTTAKEAAVAAAETHLAAIDDAIAANDRMME